MSQYKDKEHNNNNSTSNQPHHQSSHQSRVPNEMAKLVGDFISMETNATAANNALRHQQSAATNLASPTQKDIRVLRCFCGCSQLTYEQIENFLMMNVNGIIANQISNNLFKTFLKIGHRSDKANALLLIECFELADKMLNDLGSYKEYFDDLIELCPSLLWEQRLEKACDASSLEEVQVHLDDVLKALKKECLCNIEADHDFTRFKQELLRKIAKK